MKLSTALSCALELERNGLTLISPAEVASVVECVGERVADISDFEGVCFGGGEEGGGDEGKGVRDLALHSQLDCFGQGEAEMGMSRHTE